ncbi:hypothetical protein [Myxosarcina sp. GI1]|uniref:hypothetical protein n=1 Tax=Myxosarcina sp. GI1 TaxID=1541065 RepID=UPI00069018AF|nr:hypothetical protein [Myxosarcina sp. GI1]
MPDNTDYPNATIFQKANLIRRQAAYRNWHRHKSQRYILRTQLGFAGLKSSRPQACIGCVNYHGQAYGQTLATRTKLICAIHPYGWLRSPYCPDWEGQTN